MTAHRHKGLTGKWITLLGGDGAHSHPAVAHSHPELEARIDIIEAWIAAHEDAPEPPPPPAGTTRTVASVVDLKSALADDTLDEIVVHNGTYHISTANSQRADSLFIGAAYAGRTRPVLVRAETSGAVTFDGGGATYFGGITFDQGTHHQTWQGFVFDNGTATSTGIIVIGSANEASLAPGAHHITLRDVTLGPNCHGYAYDPARSNANDHGIYLSEGSTAPHDIVIEGLTLVPAAVNPLHTAIHFYTHGYATPSSGPQGVTIRRLKVSGTNQAVMVWDRTLSGLLMEDCVIDRARIGVRYEQGAGCVFRRVATTGSIERGFYSSQGTYPNVPGCTFDGCTFG